MLSGPGYEAQPLVSIHDSYEGTFPATRAPGTGSGFCSAGQLLLPRSSPAAFTMIVPRASVSESASWGTLTQDMKAIQMAKSSPLLKTSQLRLSKGDNDQYMEELMYSLELHRWPPKGAKVKMMKKYCSCKVTGDWWGGNLLFLTILWTTWFNIIC